MNISDIRPLVVSQAANCPNPVVDRAIIDATRALLSAAPVWRVELEVDTFEEGDGEVFVDLSELVEAGDFSRLVRVHNGRLHRCEGSKLFMASEPSEPVRVTVSVAPKIDATEIPKSAERYLEGIVSGALARVLRMSGQQWQDPAMAGYYARDERKTRNQAIYDSLGKNPMVRKRRLASFGA